MSTLEALAKTIPLVVGAILVLFVLVLVLPTLIATQLRSQKRKALAQKGAQQIGHCQICGGDLEAGELVDGYYRSRGKRSVIGAVRCTNAGTPYFSLDAGKKVAHLPRLIAVRFK